MVVVYCNKLTILILFFMGYGVEEEKYRPYVTFLLDMGFVRAPHGMGQGLTFHIEE